jgi:hypothetical protein
MPRNLTLSSKRRTSGRVAILLVVVACAAGSAAALAGAFTSPARVSVYPIAESRVSPVASSSKQGFGTAIKTAAQGYIAVQALDRDGHVLGTSTVVPRG